MVCQINSSTNQILQVISIKEKKKETKNMCDKVKSEEDTLERAAKEGL